MGRFSLALAIAVGLAMVSGTWSQQLLSPPGRTCGTESATAERNTYPAGGYMMVLTSIPAGLKGVFEFYLCPLGAKNGQECDDRVPLQLGDGSGVQYDLSKVEKSNKYEIPIILPDDITCDKCSVQWRMIVEDCGGNEGCSPIDATSCFDLTIREAKEQEKRLFRLLFRGISAIGRGIHGLIHRRRG